jgi:hypothetical protein
MSIGSSVKFASDAFVVSVHPAPLAAGVPYEATSDTYPGLSGYGYTRREAAIKLGERIKADLDMKRGVVKYYCSLMPGFGIEEVQS